MDAADPVDGVPAEDTSNAFGSTVTIVFSDIRGFTEYTDAHGDEPAYRMLQHHNGIVRETINLYGGHVVKTQGDSFMVSFASARTALVCAVAIQRSLGEANRRDSGPTVEIGIGVNTGEPIRDAGDFFGGTVNLAARICAEAGPGQILISDTTRMIAGKWEGLNYLDRGPAVLKGFHEPQRLYEVDWSDQAADQVTTRVSTGEGSTAAPEAMSAPSAPSEDMPAPVASTSGAQARTTTAEQPPAASAAPAAHTRMSRRALLVGGGAAALAVVGGGAWLALAGPKFVASAGTPLVKPGDRAFRDNLQGVSRGPNGMFGMDVPWEFKYDGSEYVGRVKGPFPPNLGGGMTGFSALTIDQVPEAFAMDARVVVGRSPRQARFGLGVSSSQAPVDQMVFFVTPESGQYLFAFSSRGAAFQQISQGRATSLARGSAENRLRIEVRGKTLTAYVNGTSVESVTHDAIARRPGHAVVRVAMIGEPSDGEVAVRFLETSLTAL